MNPIDWLISLLPHPQKKPRTSRTWIIPQSEDQPDLKVSQSRKAEAPQPPPAQPVRASSAEVRSSSPAGRSATPSPTATPITPPEKPLVIRRIPHRTAPAINEPQFEPASQPQAAPRVTLRITWRSLAMVGMVMLSVLLLGAILTAFANPTPSTAAPQPTAPLSSNSSAQPAPQGSSLTPTAFQPAARPTDQVIPTPTPDAVKPVPTVRSREEEYIVQRNDSLNIIARKFSVETQDIINANKIANPNQLTVGQKLIIPVVTPRAPGPSFKIIPDSELVLSPHTVAFSVQSAVAKYKGYLTQYEEKVDDQMTSGPAIVERISREYSVNPRILLAALEYQSGWVTQSTSPDSRRDYPMGHVNSLRKGLFRQLSWAANELNRGFYLWRVNGLSSLKMNDGSVVPAAQALNAGTIGVQHLMSMLYDRAGWERAVSEKGVFAAYARLFGYPFDYTYEPLKPSNLTQPTMRLPIEDGTTWSFTGAPHGGWGDGSAWAALDFAPPGDGAGCSPSAAWVTAVAGGLVVRSENGVVVLDLDQDGHEQTGWTVLYLHIASSGRVKTGIRLKAGDRIGHPSCEGGVSNGTHVHIGRRYNGEWINADGPVAFIMDGWVPEGTNVEYYGYLRRNGEELEAWDRRVPANQITR